MATVADVAKMKQRLSSIRAENRKVSAENREMSYELERLEGRIESISKRKEEISEANDKEIKLLEKDIEAEEERQQEKRKDVQKTILKSIQETTAGNRALENSIQAIESEIDRIKRIKESYPSKFSASPSRLSAKRSAV